MWQTSDLDQVLSPAAKTQDEASSCRHDGGAGGGGGGSDDVRVG